MQDTSEHSDLCSLRAEEVASEQSTPSGVFDMEMVVPISSDEDIHDKIETNDGGDVI